MPTTLTSLSFELITCIAHYLTSKEVSVLSQCNRTLYGLQWMDSLWKRFCRVEYGIQYNDPNQSFKDLFLSCCITRKNYKRLPCNHIVDEINPIILIDRPNKCQKCPTPGHENLFICITENCHQTMCDRHARQHTRLNNNTHSVYYKMNTSELFCQMCVDWIGGIESNRAEKYIVSKISSNWSNHDTALLKMREIRQIERKQRWKDTPQYIMKGDFCFISSNWMAEWEMFIEGWKTERPSSVIDQTHLLSLIAGLNRVGTNPFYLNSNDNVMIISSQTWNYLACHYKVKGEKITENYLKPTQDYSLIINRIEYWKKRALDYTNR